MRTWFAVALTIGALACDRRTPEPTPPTREATAAPASASAHAVTLSARLVRPAAPRVVAIGDLHGDLDATRRALRLAGAIDANDAWIGKALVVVQTGDEIDRGDGDRAIIDLVDKVKGEAKNEGGELIALDGNHELMNASLDFRYVTPGGFAAFKDVGAANAQIQALVAKVDEKARGRAAAFAPGGPYARVLADRPLVVKVGDTVFVHGGVLPKHVAYGLDRMNDETRAWLLGDAPAPPAVVVGEDGPVWARTYSAAPGKEECALLDDALASLGAKRMVMGHTVQRGDISAACGDKAWRIDVGMSHVFGGPVEALEIIGDTVKVLRESK